MLSFCRYCLQNQVTQNSFKNVKRTFSVTRGYLQQQNLELRKSRIKTNVLLEREDQKACLAYCTSESYSLDRLKQYFIRDSQTYTLGILPKDATDVLYVKKQNSSTSDKLEEIFLFRRLGTFVCWNVSEHEVHKLRQVFKEYELEPYEEQDVLEESELLNFTMTHETATSLIEGDIFINNENEPCQQVVEKLAFSNALALSVRLNMWEASLDSFSYTLRHIPERMKLGHKVNISRNEVLQKIGELLTLRHQINLYSDLLTTPDFYWDRDNLEKLYVKTCAYLEVGKRTKVMNEKLNLCSELVEMLRSHLNDRHSHRLEWMIIVLITIEVLFEVIRLAEKTLF